MSNSLSFSNEITNKPIGHSDQLTLMMAFCIKHKAITAAAGKVFISIASHWSVSNKMWPSRKTIASDCGYKDVRNVTQQTRKLKDLNLISFSQIVKKTKSGNFVGKNNNYSINYAALKDLHAKALQKMRNEKYKDAVKLNKTVSTDKNIDPTLSPRIDPPFSLSNSKQRYINNNANRVELIIEKAVKHRDNAIIKLKQLNWRISKGFEHSSSVRRELSRQDEAFKRNRSAIDSSINAIHTLSAKLSKAFLYKDKGLFTQEDFQSLKELHGGSIGGIMSIQASELGYGR